MRKVPTMFTRGIFLFVLGVCIFWACEALQSMREGCYFPGASLPGKIGSKLVIPLFFGAASVAVGLLSPRFDRKFGQLNVYNNEWSSVLRCAALFFGFNHATLKLNFETYVQLLGTIIGLSLALWWVFDGSPVGLAFGMASAIIATFVSQSFMWRHFSRFSNPTMLAWLICIYFSGGIVIVLVGRQLAKPDIMAAMSQKIK